MLKTRTQNRNIFIAFFSAALFQLCVLAQTDQRDENPQRVLPPSSGTFYLLSADTMGVIYPPYPCSPYPSDWEIPVYLRADGNYLVADTPEDAAQLISTSFSLSENREVMMRTIPDSLPPLPAAGSLGGTPQVTLPTLNTNGLWLEIFPGVSAYNNNPSYSTILIHNTEAGGEYMLQSSSVPNPDLWNFGTSFIAETNIAVLIADMGQDQYTSSFFRIVDVSPVAEPDYFMVQQNSLYNHLDILKNDHAPNDESFLITGYSNPIYGTINYENFYQEEGFWVSVPFSLFYTPNTNYYGVESFLYLIENKYGGEGIGETTVFVNKTGNNPPQQLAPTLLILQTNSFSATFNVLTNVTDPDNDTISLFALTTPKYGTATHSGGNITYERNPQYYGDDRFEYVVTDGKGGMLKSWITVKQIMSTNDPKIPQQWLLDYGMNLSVTNSLSDPDGDGVNNLAEYLLGTHPGVQDNLLNLQFISSGSTLSGHVYFPLPNAISTIREHRNSVGLMVDGFPVDNTFLTQRGDGAWVLKWNTTYLTNGVHDIQMYIEYGDEDEDIIAGITKSVYLSNPLRFNPVADRFSSTLVIDASLSSSNTETHYTVYLYDEYDFPLTERVFSVTDGRLLLGWNLCNAAGIQLAFGGIKAKIVPGTPDTNPNQVGTITKSYGKEGIIQNPNVFTVAWGWDEYGKNFVKQRTDLMRDGVINFLNGAVWSHSYRVLPEPANAPLVSTAFRYDTDVDKGVLTNALVGSGNFFWFGHGTDSGTIAGNPETSYLDSSDIRTLLKNKNTESDYMEYSMKPELNEGPYKLTILNSCYSYEKFMATAFGVDFIKSGTIRTAQDYKDCARQPRAFVGWEKGILVPTEYWLSGYYMSSYYQSALSSFWRNWMQGEALDVCLNAFDGLIFGTVFNGMRKWKISGCKDLTRYD